VTEFELICAGDLTSTADVLLTLNGCRGNRGYKTDKLAQELIAAILNIALGCGHYLKEGETQQKELSRVEAKLFI